MREALRLAAISIAIGGLVVSQDQPAAAILNVTGDVSTVLHLTAADLAKMPREKATLSEEGGTTIEYEGVLLREVLSRAGVGFGKELRGKALSTYVLAKARDGYQVVYTLAELDPAFANETILIADRRDGKALFGYQGPFRLVCPNDKAGARSVRMLESIEVVRLKK